MSFTVLLFVFNNFIFQYCIQTLIFVYFYFSWVTKHQYQYLGQTNSPKIFMLNIINMIYCAMCIIIWFYEIKQLIIYFVISMFQYGIRRVYQCILAN